MPAWAFWPNDWRDLLSACCSRIKRQGPSPFPLNPGCPVSCLTRECSNAVLILRLVFKRPGSFHRHSLEMHTLRSQPSYKMFRLDYYARESPTGRVAVPPEPWAQPALLSHPAQSSQLRSDSNEPRSSQGAEGHPLEPSGFLQWEIILLLC